MKLLNGNSRPAYILAQISIEDRQRYDRYASRFMQTLERHNGRLLAADERPEIVEGEWPHEKVILLAFPDATTARAWMGSDDYQKIAGDRLIATRGPVLLLEGAVSG